MPVAAKDYIVRLSLPETLLEHYEKAAEAKRQPLENYLANHLLKTKPLVAQAKPLIVTDAERQRIETALQKNFTSATELAAACESLSKVWVGDIAVTLPPAVIERLNTRCYGMPFEQFVQQEIQRLLEVEVGLR